MRKGHTIIFSLTGTTVAGLVPLNGYDIKDNTVVHCSDPGFQVHIPLFTAYAPHYQLCAKQNEADATANGGYAAEKYTTAIAQSPQTGGRRLYRV